MTTSLTFHGVDDLRRRMLALERRVGRRILAKGLRAGAKLLQKEIQDTMPVGPGEGRPHIRDFVRVKAGKRSSVKVDYFAKISTKDIPVTVSKDGRRSWRVTALEYGSHDSTGKIHIRARGTQRKALETKGPLALQRILGVFQVELEKAVRETR